MRLALLYKNGGIAIDADMLLLQPISWKSNVISTYLGQFSTKIMKFEARHPFIETCMKEFVNKYDYATKDGNGWKLIERVFADCDTCQNIDVISIFDLPVSFNVDSFYNFYTLEKNEHDSIMLEIRNETNVAVDIQYWSTVGRTLTPGSVVDRLFSENTILTDSRIADSLNKDSLMKFGTWVYEHSTNVGDEVQSIANIQYLPRIDYFLARDDPMRYGKFPNITIISNGWFSTNKKWNLPSNFHPIFVAFHGTTYFPYNSTVSLFKKFEPIGCRDLYTERRMKQLGIDAYYSGCITTTMENIYDAPRENIYLVDSKFPFPPQILNMMINKTHTVRESIRRKYPEKYARATSLLEFYGTASLVATYRIHCALPSLGMGTPVLFISYDENKSYTSLDQLFTIEPR